MGCFYASPGGDFGTSQYTIPGRYYGVASIIYCHDQAVSQGNGVFGVGNGGQCIRTGENFAIDAFGKSNDCKMACNNDLISGAICGGIKFVLIINIDI